ncbi:efflux transporter outer membrane subunit [Ponticaulis sp.]|uniref:efflux transporter outer membrane subunit n=1 Tax=Ponticaulis sp. TaxID=2020902 RepID=UPI002611F8B9|nr:efflux transporter outer membrane subunit [Ponticaulis sp.]MDF1680484.1 efflux transporter outer membrane subunit [Ponticaulis sp.]
MRAHLLLAGVAALSGCASLRHEPETISVELPATPAEWSEGALAEVPPVGDWVSAFDDPVMEDLIAEALENNPGIQAAYARVDAARATAAATYGRSLPSLSASGSATGTSSAFDNNSGGITRTDSLGYRIGLNASWEADLWGRIGAGLSAADADLVASEADFAASRLSLAANTAIAWIRLSDAVRQEALAEATLAARERILSLTERRYNFGLTGALDVRTARSAVASSEAALLSRQQNSGVARRSMEILLGRYPANELEANLDSKDLPPITGAGDPTSLLARRPDIAAAEARIAAAGFRVDQARLALRPSLSLTASLTNSADNIGDVLNPEYLAAQVISSLTAPIFNGGSLEANITAAEAQGRTASFNYVSAVLTAWKEVEDALAADAFLAAQVDAQTVAYEQALAAEGLAERQYQNGLTTIFNLIDTQTRRINAEASLISAQTSRAINRVQFHLALGGELTTDALPAENTSEGTE